MPESLSSFAQAFAGLKGDASARVPPGVIGREWGRPLSAERSVFTDFANTAMYAPTAYLPQAAGIATGRLFDASPLALLYAARFSNLLCWAFFVGLALRALPFQGLLMASLACLPASLVLAASANADVLTNGLCFWLIAVGLKKEKPALGWVLLAGVLVCVHKLIVWPLLLLYGLHRWGAYWKPALLCSAGLVEVLDEGHPVRR